MNMETFAMRWKIVSVKPQVIVGDSNNFFLWHESAYFNFYYKSLFHDLQNPNASFAQIKGWNDYGGMIRHMKVSDYVSHILTSLRFFTYIWGVEIQKSQISVFGNFHHRMFLF